MAPQPVAILALETKEGNYLVIVNGLEVLYVSKEGKYLPSKHEQERGMPLTPNAEWTWAKKEWGQEVKKITEPKTVSAILRVLKERNKFLNFTRERKRSATRNEKALRSAQSYATHRPFQGLLGGPPRKWTK